MREHMRRKGIVFGIMILFFATSIVPIVGSISTIPSTQPIQLHIDVPPVTYGTMKTGNGVFTTLKIGDNGHTTTIGEAQLPTITKFVEIPQGAIPEIVIRSVSWDTTSLDALGLPSNILPVQAPIPKIPGAKENAGFVINNEYYAQDQLFPSSPVKITEIGEIRGHRFAAITFYPVQYTPATGELTVTSSYDVQLNLPGSDFKKTNEMIEQYYSPCFEEMLKNIVINYGMYEPELIDFSRTQGYLIIVYDQFYEEIQPFVIWKQNMGYQVTVTKTSQIPGGVTKENIAAYIDEAYNSWPVPPAFVLLTGDVPQIPTWTGPASGTASDLYYVTITDGDYFPDVYLGRFPAATEAHVITMVEKTVEYEQGALPSFDFLSKATFIASSDNGQLAEQTHNYVIENFLEPNGYTCDKIYEAYGGSTSDIIDSLNDGRSLCVYSGHGGPGGWGCVPFDQDNIRYDLTNADMYPFVCSHACSTNPFDQSECFGETWLRVDDKGGLAFWGASASSYWDEDDILERGMFEAWWEEGLNFLAGMTNEALFRVWENYSGGGLSQYYYDAYNLLGDPSLGIKPPFVPEHNIAVIALNVPSHVPPGQLVTAETSIINNGQNNEYNIMVSFRVNDEEIDTYSIPFLASQSFEQVVFQWTPLEIGVFTVTINASISGVLEEIYSDNEKSTLVIVGPDVAVTSFTAPDYAAVGRTTVIAGIVANLGTGNEWVTISLKINDIVEAAEQVYLTSGSNTNVDFEWIPTQTGTYPVGIAASITGQEPYLGNNEMSKNVSVFVASGYILLVDDDVGQTYETYYINALTATGYLYQVWDRGSQGSPSASTMATYDTVIWFTGSDWSETLDTNDQANLQTYLINGGRLFITSQEVGYDIGSSAFYQNYLHATYQTDDTNIYTLLGTAGDPIGDGLTLGISGGDGANNQNYPDGIQPITPATTVFTYQSSAYKAGIKTDTAGYKVVYFAFGFEAINSQTHRNEVMYRVLQWLSPVRISVEGDCYYQDFTPADTVSVDVINLNTKRTWQATTEGNHYSLFLTPGYEVNASETLRIIARDDTESVNVTDHVVTAGEITTGTIGVDLILNVHYRDLKKFPFYPVTIDTGAAVAQMMLNYLWWNQIDNPSGPPLHYPNQQTLFNAFNTQGGLYLNTDELCSGLNLYKPLPIETYGYFFMPSANTSVNVVLKSICIWLDFTYGVQYYPGLPDNWPAPGHVANVPIAVPLDGNYNHWVAIRGIHTDRDAWASYPEFPAITVKGFWINDPKTGGLGGNTYVTAQQFLLTYYRPIAIVGDLYKNKYVALTDPPETADVDINDPSLTVEITPAGFTPLQSKIVAKGMSGLADNLIVSTARSAVQNVLKYDQTDLLQLFSESTVVGKPVYKGTECIVTFKNQHTTFIVHITTKTGALQQFTVEGV